MRPNYKRSVLKNGTILATERAKGFHSLAVGVWVKGGSRHESPSQAGMAHFLEHMMFKGTEKRSALDIARDVDLVGGDFNAMTTREYTCFHLTLPKQAMNFAIELLSDLLKNSKFDPEEIERERSVILQEFAMVEESPEEWVHEVLFEKCFGSHPLGKPILGTVKVLKTFKQKDILKYFEQHYYSKNIVITMAGDLDHKKVTQKLNQELMSFKGKRRATVKASLKKPKFHPGITIIRKDIDQVHMTLACESYRLNHKKRLAAFLMNSFLGGNMSSTLFQEIREKHGYAYTVYSSLAPFTDIGLLGIYVATSPKKVEDCLGLIRQQIQKLMEKPIAEKDLQIAKNSVKSAIWLGSDSMETRMYAIAKSELFYERHLDIPEIAHLLDQVSTSDIWNAAKELFGKDSWNIVAMGPIKKKQLEKGFFNRGKK